MEVLQRNGLFATFSFFSVDFFLTKSMFLLVLSLLVNMKDSLGLGPLRSSSYHRSENSFIEFSVSRDFSWLSSDVGSWYPGCLDFVIFTTNVELSSLTKDVV